MTSPSKSNKKPTVYELCKEKLKERNQFQNPQSQTNFHDLKLTPTMKQNWVTSSGNSNIIRVFQPCPKHELKVVNEIKRELQSAPLPSESGLFGENSFLVKVPVIHQFLLEENTCSKFITGTQSNSWSKYHKLKMQLTVCSICYAQFENKTELVRHIKCTHVKKRGRPAKPVECNLCQKKFTCKKDFAIHFQKHSDKTYTCLSCKKTCSSNVSHACKNIKQEKRRLSVWDACKEALTEKSRQVSSRNSECVPKVPISKKDAFSIGPLNKSDSTNFTSPVDKIVANSTSLLKKNKIDGTSNSINCVQSSIEQLFDKFKDFGNHQSNNLMHFKAETMSLSKMDSTPFNCNICGVSFTDMEKYEAHYSIHLDDVFCQMKEGEEELQVCNICGGCFTETNAFQAHKLTHIDTELSNIKN